MMKSRICAVIVDEDLKTIKQVEPLVGLYEVRIDLIGQGWTEVALKLRKPWIACNRRADEGGQWQQSEAERVEELLKASRLGADIVDIELRTQNLEGIVKVIKNRAKCLLSWHELKKTPPFGELKEIIQRQLKAGADICKVVTSAQRLEDNFVHLKLIREFPQAKIVSFAMGPLGFSSRVLSPLVGGEFTYASIKKGKESASGQITVGELIEIYGMVTR